MVINKLKKRDNYRVDNPKEALEKNKRGKYKRNLYSTPSCNTRS